MNIILLEIIKMEKSIYYNRRSNHDLITGTIAIILSFIHIFTSIGASHIFVHMYPVPSTYGCRYDYSIYYTIGIILSIISSLIIIPVFIALSIMFNRTTTKMIITLNAILSGYVTPIYMISAYFFRIPQCMKNMELYSISIYTMCIMNVIYLCMILYIDYILQWINESSNDMMVSKESTDIQNVELLDTKV